MAGGGLFSDFEPIPGSSTGPRFLCGFGANEAATVVSVAGRPRRRRATVVGDDLEAGETATATRTRGTTGGMGRINEAGQEYKQLEKKAPVWCLAWSPAKEDPGDLGLAVGCWDQTRAGRRPVGRGTPSMTAMSAQAVLLPALGHATSQREKTRRLSASLSYYPQRRVPRSGRFRQEDDAVHAAKRSNSKTFVRETSGTGHRRAASSPAVVGAVGSTAVAPSSSGMC